jgi:hypothetical protein
MRQSFLNARKAISDRTVRFFHGRMPEEIAKAADTHLANRHVSSFFDLAESVLSSQPLAGAITSAHFNQALGIFAANYQHVRMREKPAATPDMVARAYAETLQNMTRAIKLSDHYPHWRVMAAPTVIAVLDQTFKMKAKGAETPFLSAEQFFVPLVNFREDISARTLTQHSKNIWEETLRDFAWGKFKFAFRSSARTNAGGPLALVQDARGVVVYTRNAGFDPDAFAVDPAHEAFRPALKDLRTIFGLSRDIPEVKPSP